MIWEQKGKLFPGAFCPLPQGFLGASLAISLDSSPACPRLQEASMVHRPGAGRNKHFTVFEIPISCAHDAAADSTLRGNRPLSFAGVRNINNVITAFTDTAHKSSAVPGGKTSPTPCAQSYTGGHQSGRAASPMHISCFLFHNI